MTGVPQVHLVYPHRRIPTSPHSIGWHMADAISREFPTTVYDWDTIGRAKPRDGDILIGHPHPIPFTIMRRSWNDARWSRRIVIAPYSGDLHLVAFEDYMIRTADAYLAITGRPWTEAMPYGALSHWHGRATQLDLAVDRRAFPRLRSDSSPPGQRRVLYIGSTDWAKGTEYLEEIARYLPFESIGWMGSGRPLKRIRAHGWHDSTTSEAKAIASEYDFLIAPGLADANPTTVLEAMSWGLVPLATPTSGYFEDDGVISIPNGDAERASIVISEWMRSPGSALSDLRKKNDELLETRYTWPRFEDAVLGAVSDRNTHSAVALPPHRRALLSFAAATNPHLRNPRVWLNVLRHNWSSAPRSVVWRDPESP